VAAPSTSLVKTWCRIDGTEYDSLLPVMIAAATALASHETGVDYTTTTMPDAVQQWVAANVSYWINNPDAASAKRADPAPMLASLLDPYRTYQFTVKA